MCSLYSTKSTMLSCLNCVYIILLVPVVTSTEFACWSGWTRIKAERGGSDEDFCAKYFNVSMTWPDALATCRGLSANLLVLSNHSLGIQPSVEHIPIHPNLRSFTDENVANQNIRFWTGLHRQQATLIWESDVPELSKSPEPLYEVLRYDESSEEACASAESSDHEHWPHPYELLLEPCHQHRTFVCIKRTVDQCGGEPWLGHPETDSCYKVYRQPWQRLPFVDAQQRCAADGGVLTTYQELEMDTSPALVSFRQPVEGDLRLHGSQATEGVLEVFHRTSWGTVCDDGFDANSAVVACKYLGFTHGFRDISPPGVEELTSEERIWLVDVNCTGNERTLTDCNFSDNSMECNHQEDVYIKCNQSTTASEVLWVDSNMTSCTSVNTQTLLPTVTTCSQNLSFVCRRQLPTAEITIRHETSDVKLLSEPVLMSSSEAGAVLQCIARGVSTRRSVAFVKDTQYIDNGLAPAGLSLSLAHLGTLWTPGRLQGFYRCEVWTIGQHERLVSNQLLLTFTDYATLRASVDNRTLREIGSSLGLSSSTTYQHILERLFTQHTEVEVNRIVQPSNDVELIELSLYARYQHSQSINSQFYHSILQLVANHSQTFTIRRTDACPGVTLGSVTVPLTPIGGVLAGEDVGYCESDGMVLATGRCIGNFTYGAVWTELKVHNCLSLVRQLINNMSQTKIDSTNVVSMTSSVARLTQNYSDHLKSSDINVIARLLTDISHLSASDSRIAEDFVEIVSSLSGVDDEVLLGAQHTSNGTSRIVLALETLTGRTQLPSSRRNLTISRPHVTIQVWDLPADADQWIYGIGLARTPGVDRLDVKTFSSPMDEIVDGISAIVLSREAVEYVISWPGGNESKDSKNYRLSFTAYSKANFFTTPGSTTVTVNSLVVSASVNDVPINNLSQPIAIKLQLKTTLTGSERCAYWDTDTNSWSTDGVTTSAVDDVIVCLTRHLTNFAVIAGFDDELVGEAVVKALQLISVVGLVLSVVGYCLTILSQIVLYRSLRRNRRSPLVLLHLSVALLMVDVLVLAGVDRTENVTGCKMVAALLLYFLLASFGWMLVEAVVQYLRFVKVFPTNTTHFVLKTALPAWIVPAIITLIVIVIDFGFNVNTLQGPKNYCWLAVNTFYFGFLLPLGLTMCVNVIMFILIIKGLTCDRPQHGLHSTQATGEFVKLQVFALICCVIVMGLTWMFALFAFSHAATAMHFLFCIFNSIQGVLIFVFLNIREKPVRVAWLKMYGRSRRLANRLSRRKPEAEPSDKRFLSHSEVTKCKVSETDSSSFRKGSLQQTETTFLG